MRCELHDHCYVHSCVYCDDAGQRIERMSDWERPEFKIDRDELTHIKTGLPLKSGPIVVSAGPTFEWDFICELCGRMHAIGTCPPYQKPPHWGTAVSCLATHNMTDTITNGPCSSVLDLRYLSEREKAEVYRALYDDGMRLDRADEILKKK